MTPFPVCHQKFSDYKNPLASETMGHVRASQRGSEGVRADKRGSILGGSVEHRDKLMKDSWMILTPTRNMLTSGYTEM